MADTPPSKPRNFTAATPFSLIGILISIVLGLAIALLVLAFVL